MATYAIGDIQGCDRELVALLEKLGFGESDELWLAGDLINRGPDSLKVLRRLYRMSGQCHIVLGNHDLHFLAILYGGHSPGRSDTLDELLEAEDVAELGSWLRQQKLVHLSEPHKHVLVHAGIPAAWSIDQALMYASEVEQVMQGNAEIGFADFFRQMYGNEPAVWSDSLRGMSRLRAITNYLTRMRLVDAQGVMDFAHKGALAAAPKDLQPWYKGRVAQQSPRVLFGHWAALAGHTGQADAIALDTGCVWGRSLTAYCLETGQFIQQQAL